MQLILVVGAADLLFLVLLSVGLAAIGLHAITDNKIMGCAENAAHVRKRRTCPAGRREHDEIS